MPIIKKSYHLPILLAIGALLFFSHLNSWSPPTIMEARNFISAREMLISGDWLIPTLNGEVRIRKPPLPTWLTAISAGLFGDPNDLAALRLPAAFAALLTVFFLYGLIKDLMNNADVALFGAVVLSTAFMFIQESHTGSWDIYCNAFMLGGVWMFYRATIKTDHLKYFLLASVLFGASFLSKGPVSFYTILLPFLFAFIVTGHPLGKSKNWGVFICVLFTLTLSAAWPLYLHFKIPDIAMAIADEESSAWVNRHNRPPWFYLHFPLFMGIWAFIALFALIRWKELMAFFDRKKTHLIIIWFLATFILLSVVPEKKERYFLPALIPLAMWTGLFLFYHTKSILGQSMSKIHLFFLKFQSILNIVVAAAVPAFLWLYGYKYFDLSRYGFIASCILFAMLVAVGIWITAKKKWILVYPFNVLITVIFILTAWPFIPNGKLRNRNYQDLRAVRGISEIVDLPLYTHEALGPERMWEIGRKIQVLDANEPLPEAHAVIITREKIPTDSFGHYVFHYDPKNEESVLHFYIKK